MTKQEQNTRRFPSGMTKQEQQKQIPFGNDKQKVGMTKQKSGNDKQIGRMTDHS
jgi:hypothetical protein